MMGCRWGGDPRLNARSILQSLLSILIFLPICYIMFGKPVLHDRQGILRSSLADLKGKNMDDSYEFIEQIRLESVEQKSSILPEHRAIIIGIMMQYDL